DRILQAIEDGNYKRALSLAEESEEDPEYKKDPEVYFLKAEALLELMKDEFWLKKNPEALKMGLKALDKGKSRTEDNTIWPEYSELVDKYVELNDMEAYNNYRVNRFSKAIGQYLKSNELNGNKISLFWAGKCYVTSGDTAEGEKIYLSVIYWANEQKAEGKKVSDKLLEPYVHFADKYWTSKKLDSANMYLVSARKIFGGTPKIDYYQKEIAKQQIDELPPSSLMMEVIQRALNDFPTDTFFVRKENALYVYLLRTYYDNKDTAALDTMLDEFTNQKIFRSESEHASKFKESDQFLDNKAENVIWKLVTYYSKYDHIPMSNFMCHRYIQQTATSQSKEDIKKRYLVIIDYAARSRSLFLANQILTNALKMYKNDPEFLNIQNSLISQFSGKELNVADLGALYDMSRRKEGLKAKPTEDFQKLSEFYMDQLIRDKQYVKAKKLILEHKAIVADNPIWDLKLKYLAKEDFYWNYFETRVVDEEVAGMLVKGFEWNGDLLTCDAGTIKPELQQKVQNRINYFRRQAGVPEIELDPQLNEWCQKAALIMEANKGMNHDPKPNWSCYSDEGREACKYSLLTTGAHTTMAVTSFFADNRNPNLGHRRWLLFPNSKYLGHGSTENYCALWALDDSGNVDTNLYKERFVAWPAEGLIPKMMVFDQWSFSINQDLSGAKITMTEAGKPVTFTQNPMVEGYGLSTLIWKPQLDFSTMSGDRTFQVVIQLKNGRKYTYSVTVMDWDAVGY
ncbi:MAG: CAP domain-containing protein, partial [Bacteroidetes bacterium]|nr:CAP domain-containing protein [Bacteroidota bacterium]